jgi:hypothetical protein
VDDVLMFTVRSRGEPFVGKFFDTTLNRATTTESQVAEVIYFCAPAYNSTGVQTDATLYLDAGTPIRTATLYRRVLLVNPGLAQSPEFNSIPVNTVYYDRYDVSARIGQTDGGAQKLVPNSLGDLTKREFRFAHLGAAYPAVFPFDVATTMPGTHPLVSPNGALTPFSNERLSDDVLLTNVLSFDVQVYDPGAAVRATSTAALAPPDPGLAGAGNVGGAYADLGSNYPDASGTNIALFNLALPGATVLTPVIPAAAFPYAVVGNPSTYDTWSLHYENNGIDDDGDGKIDEGTNGLDDDTAGAGFGIVDDAGEMETRTPFPAQLRGVRITIRVYEPSSQQVRQMTVVGDFLPD